MDITDRDRAIAELARLGKELLTQDNACTADPLFVVQQRVREYGVEWDYADGQTWVVLSGDFLEADPEEAKELDEKEAQGADLGEWEQVGYRDYFEVVQSFLTRKAAQTYIDENKHNLRDPRVFVDSCHRNMEMKRVRAALIALAKGE